MPCYYVIEGKKFDQDASELLHDSGMGDACCREDGSLQVYRSPKGTAWAVFKYWPNAYGNQHCQAVCGEAAVRRLCASLNRHAAIEAAFGMMPDG